MTAKLIKFGFIHDKAAANEFLKSSGIKSEPDAGEDTFFFQFDSAIEGQMIVDITIDGHVYSMTGSLGATKHACYGSIGTSKEKTSFDFVDKQPVAQALEAWPTIKPSATQASMTVSTFTGGIETYPAKLTQVNGPDDKPVKDVGIALSTTAQVVRDLEEEKKVADHKEAARKGCDFDAKAAKAIHGKNVLFMAVPSEEYVTAHEGVFTDGIPLALGGQTGLNWSVEAETSTSNTKDGDGEWATNSAGQKSWSTSVDNLWMIDDDGRNMIMDAFVNGTPVCIGAYKREKKDKGYKYIPLRKGMAYATSDEFDAPSDDNVTGSIEFTGTGELWMYETAAEGEVEAMTIDTSQE